MGFCDVFLDVSGISVTFESIPVFYVTFWCVSVTLGMIWCHVTCFAWCVTRVTMYQVFFSGDSGVFGVTI